MRFDYKLDTSGPRIVSGLKKNSRLKQGTLTVFDRQTAVHIGYFCRGTLLDLEMPGGLTLRFELANGESLSEQEHLVIARLDTLGIIFLNFPATLSSVDLTVKNAAADFNADCGVILAALSQALSAISADFVLDKRHQFMMVHNSSYGRNVTEFSLETLENFFSMLQGHIATFPNSRLFKRVQELQESGHEIQAANPAAP